MLDSNAIFKLKRKKKDGGDELLIEDLSTPLVPDTEQLPFAPNDLRKFIFSQPPEQSEEKPLTLTQADSVAPNDLSNLVFSQPDEYDVRAEADNYSQMINPATEPPVRRSPGLTPGATSGETMDEINRTQTADRSEFRESGFWNRVGAGLWRAFKMWGQSGGQGGLAGLVGALATGGATSGFSPSADAEARREGRLGNLWNKFGQQANAEKFQNDQANDASVREARTAQTQIDLQKQMTAEQKLLYDRLDGAKKEILDVWKDLDEFDPNSEQNKIFVEKAKALGVELLPKEKGERFNFQVAPDGRIIVGNTKTGEYKVGADTFARPKTISQNDLPDTLFGLDDDKSIADKAAARIGKLPDTRRLRANAPIPAEYKNADGSFNEQAFLSDLNLGLTKINLSDIYENVSDDNYSQRLAGERTRIRNSQAVIRREVDRFRTAISNYTPKPDAQAQPLDKVVGLFNKILSIKNTKERAAKLQIFYDNLSNIKIQ